MRWWVRTTPGLGLAEDAIEDDEDADGDRAVKRGM